MPKKSTVYIQKNQIEKPQASSGAILKIPREVADILGALNQKGFEAYAVGGCVRDLLLGQKPADWDVATNAVPKEIQSLFPKHFYENDFGTVTVLTDSEDPALREVQITPFRTESAYSDKRHPDEVRFAKTLAEDVSRRDFTVNAMAMDAEGKITDLVDGMLDLEKKRIRAVGNPEERFDEDALRMLRAVRFAVRLGFAIDAETMNAIIKKSGLLCAVSKERIRDEFVKIIQTDQSAVGIEILRATNLLEHIVPELLEGVGVGQNLHHVYTVWEHNLRALAYATEQGYALTIRLASLFHDIGKPRTKRGEGAHCTFYNHDAEGARMAKAIMERLKFPREITEAVTKLVRYHLFYYNVGEVSESSVRRLVANVGLDLVHDLIRVREADRIGSGTPKAVPYKLRHLKYMIDKVSSDPISVKMLAIRGEDVIRELGAPPGPMVGLIMRSLLAETLDDPALNTKERLIERVRDLKTKTPEQLAAALERIEQAQEEEEKARMKKYYVG